MSSKKQSKDLFRYWRRSKSEINLKNIFLKNKIEKFDKKILKIRRKDSFSPQKKYGGKHRGFLGLFEASKTECVPTFQRKALRN